MGPDKTGDKGFWPSLPASSTVFTSSFLKKPRQKQKLTCLGRGVHEKGQSRGSTFRSSCAGCPLLLETVEAKKGFLRRRRDLDHQLFSTTGAGRLKAFLRPPFSGASSGKASRFSCHSYPPHRILLSPRAPILISAIRFSIADPGILRYPGVSTSALQAANTSPRQRLGGPFFLERFRIQPRPLQKEP